MRVLFLTRPTVFSGPGGDTIQLLKTKQYLKDLGCEVVVAETVLPNIDEFDLVHFFNLRNPQDILLAVRECKKKGVPSVLSTIWGSYYECDRYSRKGLQGLIVKAFPEHLVEYFKSVARMIVNGNRHRGSWSYLLTGHLAAQREIVKTVDMLLPNSTTELARVRSDMAISSKVGEWIPNAVDLSVFDYPNTKVSKYAELEGCLLCAARVEIRKCQLELIKAVRGLDIKLVIVGKPSPNGVEYYEKCKDEADENVVFIEHVSQNELAELYKVAKAHALVSWMETPGLSSLEAAVMRCNLLITRKGDTEFYFDDLATYCAPSDIESIRQGVREVMTSDFNDELRHRVISNYTWKHTAEKTFKAYRQVLNKRVEGVAND